MNKYDNKMFDLQQYVKKLYVLSGQFNLYVSLCCNENNADIERLKIEIEKITQTVVNIENEIDDLKR